MRPSILGRELDADVATGPAEPAGRDALRLRDDSAHRSSVAALAKVTGDRELALTTLVVRAVERERTHVSPSDALVLERRIVRLRFGGSASAYRAALAHAGASSGRSRADLSATSSGRASFAGRLAVLRSRRRDVARFRATFAPVVARELVVSPAPSWLPDGRGVAAGTSAPERVFRLPTGRRDDDRAPSKAFSRRGSRRRDRPRCAPVRARPARDRPRAHAPSAARTPTRRGRSACRRPPRASSSASETDCPSSASSTARRTRRSSRSRSPRPTLARGPRRRLGSTKRRREQAASRPSRPCHAPSSSRVRARRLRAR